MHNNRSCDDIDISSLLNLQIEAHSNCKTKVLYSYHSLAMNTSSINFSNTLKFTVQFASYANSKLIL